MPPPAAPPPVSAALVDLAVELQGLLAYGLLGGAVRAIGVTGTVLQDGRTLDVTMTVTARDAV